MILLIMAALFVQPQLYARDAFSPVDFFLVPQTVFVGDRGRLVALLGEDFNTAETFVLEAPAELPDLKDIVISRIELERRNNNIRLILDFVPFAVGLFVLPPVEIRTLNSEPLYLIGLEITVASILTPDHTALSPPALPLAVPGTGFLVYGTSGVIIVFLIALAVALLNSGKFFGPFLHRMKMKKLLAVMERMTHELRSSDIESDPERERELFANLAGEFREYLSSSSGIDCHALIPSDFNNIERFQTESNPGFLCKLFRQWEKLRFSGAGMPRNDVLMILDEVWAFIGNAGAAEKA